MSSSSEYMSNPVSDEDVVAYVLGMLPEQATRSIEAAAADDRELAAKIDLMRLVFGSDESQTKVVPSGTSLFSNRSRCDAAAGMVVAPVDRRGRAADNCSGTGAWGSHNWFKSQVAIRLNDGTKVVGLYKDGTLFGCESLSDRWRAIVQAGVAFRGGPGFERIDRPKGNARQFR